MLRVGIIGCGAIGSVLAEAICSGKAGGAKLVAVYDLHREACERLRRSLGKDFAIAGSITGLLAEKPDLVVEAASQEAVRQYGEPVLKSGRHLMVMSVGALLDDRLRGRLAKAAGRSGARIYIPTGAAIAVDALKAASAGKLRSVTLTTRKPPAALGIKGKMTAAKVIYRGNAEEAVRKYPQNINVAATLSIAGLGKRRTKVVIIADPKISRNIHELEVKGDFGEFTARIGNVPSPKNPKTSYMAALSAIRLLKNFTDVLKVGT